MPYSGGSDPKLPDYIKKKPLKVRKAFSSAFNSAYNSFDPKKHKAGSAEEYAFAVANSVVKKMSSKKKESISFFPKGTKFVTAREVESYDSIIDEFEKYSRAEEIMEDVDLKEYTIGDVVLTPLLESKIDKDSGTAEIVAIEQGWSKNGRYYSKEVAESISSLLLARPKIYLNHVEESVKKLGRNLHDWAATVEESYSKDGKTYAKIRFCENPNTKWILQEAVDHPDQVQFSIDALARAKEGEAEGRNGTIIEKVVMLDSLDLVDYAAAGGKLINAYASSASNSLDLIHEAAETLKDRLEKQTEKHKLDILFNCFMNMLYELSWCSEYDEEEKRLAINELIDEFLNEFNNIDIVKAFESFLNKEENMNLVELKEKHPDLVEQMKAEFKESAEVKESENAISTLNTKVAELTTSLEKAQADVEAAKSETKSAQESLRQYTDKEKEEAKKAKIKESLDKASLGELDKLPEYIQKDLLSKETDEELKEAIDAIATLASKRVTAVVNDNGVTSPNKPEGQEDKSKLATDNDEAARIFKGRR